MTHLRPLRPSAPASGEPEFDGRVEFCVHGVSEREECEHCGFDWQPAPASEPEEDCGDCMKVRPHLCWRHEQWAKNR